MGGVVHGLLASLKSAAAEATDSFFKYVTLLLHGDGTNGAQNNTFLDGSTNNFTITRNGNTTQGTFSPFSQTGWSNYFDGTGDYLTVPAGSAFAYGTGNFTLEAWIYPTVSGAQQIVFSQTVSGTNYFVLLIETNNTINFVFAISGGGTYITPSTPLTISAWNHVAVCRTGTGTNQTTVYLNGVGTSGTCAQDFTNTTYVPTIGRYTHSASLHFNGYISNLRIVKGTAVYTATFTPPTAPLTAITNTSLLTCQSNRFIDNSSNAFTITRNGDVRVEAFSPFNPTAAWSASTNGGSGYFDGTGDSLQLADNAAFEFGSGDFTLEAWIRPTAYATLNNGQYNSDIISKDQTSLREFGFYISGTASSYTAINFIGFSNNTTFTTITGTQAFDLGVWYHVAAVRSGNNVYLYVNGVQVNSTTAFSQTIQDTASVVYIGARNFDVSNQYFFPGYISNLRVVKGTAVYTANFTPPTAPLTAITNTSLLLNFTNGGIFDNASQTVLETVGNAQVSTTQKKYGTGSMYFDGTDDRLVMPARPPMAVGSGNFTIEGWVYRLDTNTRGVFQLSGTAGGLQANTTTNLALGSDAGSVWRIYANNSAYNSTATWAINTWYHFALVRNSGTTTLYIDGTSVISQADTVNYTGQNLCIGGFYNTTFLMNGYIDDLRITNGYARYTGNFTPPTAAFPDN